jgi:hypothetical protein
MPAVRKVLDTLPEFWRDIGDVAAHTAQAFVTKLAGKDALLQECTQRTLAAMTQELEGPNPSPLETLLARRITIDWLFLCYVENLEAQWMGDGTRTLAQAAYSQKRVDQAHRRYLRGIKALATVRRLGVPVVQVNVAEQQVNVAG